MSIKDLLKWTKMKPLKEDEALKYIRSNVIELNNVTELKKAFGWTEDPILNDRSIFDYKYIEDANERKIRDAETIGTVVRNTTPSICVDIGTSEGHSAALMSENAPQAQIFTINAPPEELASGDGGEHITHVLKTTEIGRFYREKQRTNITQLFVNTKEWSPNVGVIDVAYIDGCHDTEFVYNDTKKVLQNARSGSFVLWHDFSPKHVHVYPWIRSVCCGVEQLYREKLIKGRILSIRDSWVGVYRVS